MLWDPTHVPPGLNITVPPADIHLSLFAFFSPCDLSLVVREYQHPPPYQRLIYSKMTEDVSVSIPQHPHSDQSTYLYWLPKSSNRFKLSNSGWIIIWWHYLWLSFHASQSCFCTSYWYFQESFPKLNYLHWNPYFRSASEKNQTETSAFFCHLLHLLFLNWGQVIR